MLHFDSDYMEGAHPEILRRLVAGNLQKQPGYGADAICASARRRIRTACGCPDAAVYFLYRRHPAGSNDSGHWIALLNPSPRAWWPQRAAM